MTQNTTTRKRVFLGGTCNGSEWRDKMMRLLDNRRIEYFDPVVDDWNADSMANELRERESCDVCLYTITPKMTGTYSIAEVVDDSNKRPKRTVLVILRSDGDDRFTDSQWRSLEAVARMVIRNGGMMFANLMNAANGIAAS